MITTPVARNGDYIDADGIRQNLWEQCRQKDARIAELETKQNKGDNNASTSERNIHYGIV